ncbi:MAG: type II secretion system protein [Dehalococcoidia bacterium]
MAQNRSGFTLIEVLVVTLIIGLLAAIALPKFANSKEQAYDASAVADLRNLVLASESYFADHLLYPSALADLPDWVPSDGIVVMEFHGHGPEVHIQVGHRSSSHNYNLNYPFGDIVKRDNL